MFFFIPPSRSVQNLLEAAVSWQNIYHLPRNFYLITIPFTRQETLGYLASRSHYPL